MAVSSCGFGWSQFFGWSASQVSRFSGFDVYICKAQTDVYVYAYDRLVSTQ